MAVVDALVTLAQQGQFSVLMTGCLLLLCVFLRYFHATAYSYPNIKIFGAENGLKKAKERWVASAATVVSLGVEQVSFVVQMIIIKHLN